LRAAETADEPTKEGSEVISAVQALRILEECEEAGLVHTVSNVQGGWDWICNCCSCCCEWLRGYTEWQIETAVVRNYRVALDAAACSGCGRCEERCQVGAIAMTGERGGVTGERADERAGVHDARVTLRSERCIGCGLCVTTCPESALQLERLPQPDITLPPRDYRAWEEERLLRASREPDAGTERS
jgi:ferredoxin